ncbi:hypothetical protein C5Y96_17035 [Blastopirellula marina]|uniref:Uncharacterized protein n=1 Tax=Blastopirellula marina TaxID=124 RepID=A0A2S8F7E7_9BACT|nr:hypothetical protein C5Y96_17035 [Blastopirellula marina]RCS48501.1 hypothetical protein DTL36_17055 [Bremerella cremea]
MIDPELQRRDPEFKRKHDELLRRFKREANREELTLWILPLVVFVVIPLILSISLLTLINILVDK